MALTKRLQKTPEDKSVDITKNLFSLQFESALTEEEKELLHLRARSHAIAVHQCAQATYLVEILREIRTGINHLKNPNSKRTSLILGDNKPRLLVGILGCGRLGSQIAHCLLTYGKVKPHELQISTRRPETLEYLQQRGVDCYYDNVRLAATVNVMFVTTLPSQMTGAAEEIKDHLPSATLVYVPTTAIPLRRLRQMFDTTNIVQPEYWWPEENRDLPWNHTVNVNMALERKDVVEKTCPICDDTSDQVILVNPKLAEVFVFAAINLCVDMQISRSDTLDAVHLAVFGSSEKHPLSDKLTLADFGATDNTKEESFPFYDLVQVWESHSYVTQRLAGSAELRAAFVRRYWTVFEEYLHVRIYGTQ